MPQPHTRVSWEGLLTYPGYRYRIYSAPLGVERFVFIISPHPPGATGVLHSHPDAEEVYLLLSGEASIVIGDEEFQAKPLDAFRAAPGVIHANSNPGDREAYWVVIATPSDEFVAESDWYASGATHGIAQEGAQERPSMIDSPAFGRPPADGSSVGAHCGLGLPATAVGWNDLENYPGSRYRIYSAPLGVERFGFVVSRQPPGAEGIMHAHTDAEEIYVLLSGAGRIQLGDETFDARPLDGFRAPPGVMHANSNPSSQEIYWLVMAAPLGEFTDESEWYEPGSTLGVRGASAP
jgi:mannose-6-phosphate isomerase-like protein (cupin superfamily)